MSSRRLSLVGLAAIGKLLSIAQWEEPMSNELQHIELLADVDSLMGDLDAWSRQAGDWPPARQARALVRRLAERTDTLRVRLEAHAVPRIPDGIEMQTPKIARRRRAGLRRPQNLDDLHALRMLEAFERLPHEAAHSAPIGCEVECINPQANHFASCGNKMRRISENPLNAPCVMKLAHALLVLL